LAVQMKGKRVLHAVIFILLGVFLFIFFLYIGFPYETLERRIIGETDIEKKNEKENAKEDENDSVENPLALHLDDQWLSPLPRLPIAEKG